MNIGQKLLGIFNAQQLFNIGYGAVLISPILGGEYTAVFAFIGYIFFLTNAKTRQIDHITKVCIAGLIISFSTMVVLLLVHWDTVFTGRGRPELTFIGIGWFGVAFMLIDAVRFQVTHYKINLRSFTQFVLILLFVSIVVKMGWIYFTESGVEFRHFFQTVSRRILIVDLTPNHADNVVIFQIVLASWLTLMLMGKKFQKFNGVMITAICLYMAFQFLVINSRSAFVGLIIASVLVALPYVKNLSKIQAVAILGCLIVFAFILPGSVVSRIQIGSMQIYNLFDQSGVDEKSTKITSRQKMELRNNVIDILKGNTPNDKNSKTNGQKIWELCYAKDSPAELADQYKIDVSISFRSMLLVDGFQLWKKYPYLGYGNYDKLYLIENSPQIDSCRIGYFSHIHNHYLSLILRGGLFSLSVFMILSSLLFYLLLTDRMGFTKMRSYSAIPPLMYFLYLYVENFFDLSFNKDAPLSAILFGLSVIVGVNLRNTEQANQGNIDVESGPTISE